MVLKNKFILILFSLTYIFSLKAEDQIIFTDKYDANYFSSSNVSSTQLFIGSDLFQFLNEDMLKTCELFIDSFLREELGSHNIELSFNNENIFKISISDLNIENCRNISYVWSENYKINFQNKLLTVISEINKADISFNAKKLVLREVSNLEKTRFFNQNNNVNNVRIAFEIPQSLTNNDFEKIPYHLNIKRYTSKEINLKNTQIIYNNSLSKGSIKYIFPTTGKNTFLKNCFALSFFELIYKDEIDFNQDYSLCQVITSYTVSYEFNNIENLYFQFEKLNFSESGFNILKKQVLDNLTDISNNNYFFYNYFDLQNLNETYQNFTLNDYYIYLDILNSKRNYVLEINDKSDFTYKNQKLSSTNFNLFNEPLFCKNNSVNLLNKEDSLLINKLKVFMIVNNNYKLTIKGISKKSEFLHIDKDKVDELSKKYEFLGYVASKKKKLSLFRALSIFETLNQSGISKNRIKCYGVRGTEALIEFDLSFYN